MHDLSHIVAYATIWGLLDIDIWFVEIWHLFCQANQSEKKMHYSPTQTLCTYRLSQVQTFFDKIYKLTLDHMNLQSYVQIKMYLPPFSFLSLHQIQLHSGLSILQKLVHQKSLVRIILSFHS